MQTASAQPRAAIRRRGVNLSMPRAPVLMPADGDAAVRQRSGAETPERASRLEEYRPTRSAPGRRLDKCARGRIAGGQLLGREELAAVVEDELHRLKTERQRERSLEHDF